MNNSENPTDVVSMIEDGATGAENKSSDDPMKVILSELHEHCRVSFTKRTQGVPPPNIEKLQKHIDEYIQVFNGHVEAMGGKFNLSIVFPEGMRENFSFFEKKKSINASSDSQEPNENAD